MSGIKIVPSESFLSIIPKAESPLKAISPVPTCSMYKV
ncbi:hypothetical protein AWRI1631_130260 [Saccharomyces cerevisiae AWRI1631]|uniref:Uncharacterized protein n=1 Tax=Saccharomyces cerevisiae (strain AWRI1631) TaxID=545124 RepID=B5VP23_YEAS6|nr:hypothetical protein AWRI1631_130260 [Saccharomyces cerevisiae AWRI1631]